MPTTVHVGPRAVVPSESELFDCVSSVAVVEAVAWSVGFPGARAATRMSTVAGEPTVTVPRAQSTAPGVGVQVPWLGVALPKLTFEGRSSCTVTPVASSGPAVETVRT